VKKNVWKILGLVLFLTFAFYSLTLASEKDKVRFQGVIVELDLKKKVMVINETTFFWNENTIFNTAKGVPIAVDRFKPKDWVYAEGEYDQRKKKVAATKIYLLPKYIEKKERHLYPFMQ